MLKTTPARVCQRCVMNSAVDPKLELDADGICNHCLRYDRLVGSRVICGDAGRRALEEQIQRIRQSGGNSEYDCIIGVSGGVDSSYVAYLVKDLGLRPLAIHFDNGWDTELSVANIRTILDKLSIPFDTYVVDWREFRDLQLAFLRASVPDGEVPTDHAIQAVLWQAAIKHKVPTIISGMNFRTEAIHVEDWSYGHNDWRYIKDVHARFGTLPIKSYPHYSLAQLLYYNGIRRVRTLSILNYLDYDKDEAKKLLADEFGWRDYGGKHYESLYTRFYQGVILPTKFGVDKRYGHLSDLINAGQMSREQALAELEQPPYNPKLQESDRLYVQKKLGLSDTEFQAIMDEPVKSYRDYRNSYKVVMRMRQAVQSLRERGYYGL